MAVFPRASTLKLQRHYGRLIEATRSWGEKNEAEASPPRGGGTGARYRQGKDARTEWCLSKLPDGLRDGLIMHLLGC